MLICVYRSESIVTVNSKLLSTLLTTFAIYGFYFTNEYLIVFIVVELNFLQRVE